MGEATPEECQTVICHRIRCWFLRCSPRKKKQNATATICLHCFFVFIKNPISLVSKKGAQMRVQWMSRKIIEIISQKSLTPQATIQTPLFGQDAIKTPRIFDRLPDALNCIDLKKSRKYPTACGNSNLEHAINGVTTSNAVQNWTNLSAKKERKRQQTFASKFTNSSQTNNYKIHFTW